MTDQTPIQQREYLPICCETLHTIDHGAFGKTVNGLIDRVLRDISNRKWGPGGKVQKRNVTIKLDWKPRLGERHGERELIGVDLEATATVNIPGVRSSTIDIQIRDGMAMYNQMIPESFQDRSLFDGEEDDE